MTTPAVSIPTALAPQVGARNLRGAVAPEHAFEHVFGALGEERASPAMDGNMPGRGTDTAQAREDAAAQARDQRQLEEERPDDDKTSASTAVAALIADQAVSSPVYLQWAGSHEVKHSGEPSGVEQGLPKSYGGCASALKPPGIELTTPVQAPIDSRHFRNLKLTTFLSPASSTPPEPNAAGAISRLPESRPASTVSEARASVIVELDQALDNRLVARPSPAATSRHSVESNARKTGMQNAPAPPEDRTALPELLRETRHGMGRNSAGYGHAPAGPAHQFHDLGDLPPTAQTLPAQASEPHPDLPPGPYDLAASSDQALTSSSQDVGQSKGAAHTPIVPRSDAAPRHESIQRLSLDIMRDSNNAVGVTMSNRAGRLSINVAAPDVVTLKDIERNAHALVERLQARGVDVNDVSVRLAPAPTDQNRMTDIDTRTEPRGERSPRHPAQEARRDDRDERDGDRGMATTPGGRSDTRVDLVV